MEIVRAYDVLKQSFIDEANKSHTSMNNCLLHKLSKVIRCLMDAAGILLAYSRQERETLLSELLADYNEKIDALSKIKCDSFLSQAASRCISQSLGFNIHTMRKELERKFGEIVKTEFVFTHVLHFMAVSVINQHFIFPHVNALNSRCDGDDPNASELAEYGGFDSCTKSSYQYMAIVFIQHLIKV